MLELELQQYLLREYPQENARCEWKEFKNLKNSFSGDEKNDVISYVSAIANMEGGHLVIGVKDNTYLKNVLPTNKTEEQQLRMLGDLLAQFKFSVASSRGANQRWCIHDTGRTGCPQCHAAVL